MTELFHHIWQWKASAVKGALYVFVAMASVFLSTLQGWDDSYVANLRWWNWVTLWLSAFVAGANATIGFIDKSVGDNRKQIAAADAQIRSDQQ